MPDRASHAAQISRPRSPPTSTVTRGVPCRRTQWSRASRRSTESTIDPMRMRDLMWPLNARRIENTRSIERYFHRKVRSQVRSQARSKKLVDLRDLARRDPRGGKSSERRSKEPRPSGLRLRAAHDHERPRRHRGAGRQRRATRACSSRATSQRATSPMVTIHTCQELRDICDFEMQYLATVR